MSHSDSATIIANIAKEGRFYFKGHDIDKDALEGFVSYVLIHAVADDYIIMTDDDTEEKRASSKEISVRGVKLLNKVGETIDDVAR